MWWRRSDGTLVRNLPPTRQVMPYLMRGRNESTVYFGQDISIAKSDEFISAWNQANPMLRIDIFHLTVWGLRDALERNPTVHRFVAGVGPLRSETFQEKAQLAAHAQQIAGEKGQQAAGQRP